MMSTPDMNMMGMMNYCPMMYNCGMGMCPYMSSQMPGNMYQNMPMTGTGMTPGMTSGMMPGSVAGMTPGMMPGMMYPFEMKRIDESDDLEFEDDDDETRAPQKVDEILKKIEVNSPMIFRRMAAYGIPAYAARRIVRRIVYLTLLYEK